jgi:hypothetical protein
LEQLTELRIYSEKIRQKVITPPAPGIRQAFWLRGLNMSIKRNAAGIATTLLMIAAPAFSQDTVKSTDPAVLARQKHNVLMAGRELVPALSQDKNAAGWQDISAAPSFPVPLFRGNQTKFMKLNTGAGETLEETINKYGRQITMMTNDSPYVVYQWYSRYLPSSGFKIDDRFPKQAAGGRTYLVKGDSSRAQAIVTIAPTNNGREQGSQITVTVSNRIATSLRPPRGM